MSSSDARWESLLAGVACPLCLPRPDTTDHWIKVATLRSATLYLDRNQTYRGHCQLVFDGRHAVGLENLTPEEFTIFMADVGQAGRAIARACRPDLMNYASLGNVVPHLHLHLVPRYRSDPRWGGPIYTTTPAEMPVTRLAEAEYERIVRSIHDRLADTT
jgi:diadenosine tetraphosphate (Ap4A) HIT family hydrolase